MMYALGIWQLFLDCAVHVEQQGDDILGGCIGGKATCQHTAPYGAKHGKPAPWHGFCRPQPGAALSTLSASSPPVPAATPSAPPPPATAAVSAAAGAALPAAASWLHAGSISPAGPAAVVAAATRHPAARRTHQHRRFLRTVAAAAGGRPSMAAGSGWGRRREGRCRSRCG